MDFATFLIEEITKFHKIFIPQRIFMQIANSLYLHKEKTPFKIPWKQSKATTVCFWKTLPM